MRQLEEFQAYFFRGLSGIYNENEKKVLFRILLEDVFGLPEIEIRSEKHTQISEEQLDILKQSLNQLKTGKPIQLITGLAYFYGDKYYTSPHVLIPRPETEELVDKILSDIDNKQRSKLKIIDIGTGSGCIAISLKKRLPNSTVYALDVSKEALLTAKKNAGKHTVDIHFIQADILEWAGIFQNQHFDIIVSNPPYIQQGEKKEMEKNVLNYEPHLALFVPDESPLLFYDAIADFAQSHLSPEGKIYFEINQRLGQEVLSLLKTKNFSSLDLLQDINGADRIVLAKRKVF